MGLSRNSTFRVNPRLMLVVGGFESQTRRVVFRGNVLRLTKEVGGRQQRVEADQGGGRQQRVEADQGGGRQCNVR